MKSLCIKTNNQEIISYLLNEFETINLDTVYISHRKFKNYNNVILHYIGTDLSSFLNCISNIMTYCIFIFFEKKNLKNMLEYNFFYFDEFEQNKILDYTYLQLNTDTDILLSKYNLVYNSVYEFLKNNKSIILSGFVNFRLKEYIKLLDANLELAVNNFVIEREYYEFINLLKLYINSKTDLSKSNFIHLVYKDKKTLLLDENKKIIEMDDSIFKVKYLSDISFSSNDIAFNTLINLLPSKIYIHIIDGCIDEFINTIQLVFESRVSICNDCDICNIYKEKDFIMQ